MRMVLWNILDGAPDRWPLCERWLHEIQPDLLALCECNGWDEDLARERLTPLGLDSLCFLPTGSGYHLCCASREPMELLTAVTEGFNHGAMKLRHPRCDIIVTHLTPHRTPEALARRWHEAGRLIELHGASRNCLICGDLNSLSPADADRLEADVDPDALRQTAVARLLDHGLVDAGAGVDPRFSMPTAIGLHAREHKPQCRLDYCLVTPELAAHCGPAVIHQEEPLPYASDHFPVVMQIDAPGGDLAPTPAVFSRRNQSRRGKS